MVSISSIITNVESPFGVQSNNNAQTGGPVQAGPAYQASLSQAAQMRAGGGLPDVPTEEMDAAWAENARSVIAGQITSQSGAASSLYSGLDPARVAQLLGLD